MTHRNNITLRYYTCFSSRTLRVCSGFSMMSVNIRSNMSCVCATYRICCSPSTRLFTLMTARKLRAVRQMSEQLTANKHDLPLAIRTSPLPTISSPQKPPSHMTISTSCGIWKQTHTGHVFCICIWSVNLTWSTITSNVNMLVPGFDIVMMLLL